MSISPKDILPDDDDSAMLNGRKVRKGSIAAFMANIDVIENPNATVDEKSAAIDMLKTLAPDLIALNLHKHVTFKNSTAGSILDEADKK